MSVHSDRRQSILLGLAAAFIASIVTAQLISSKLIPLNWPVEGVMYPGGTIAYALTFIATDIVAEMYGKKRAKSLVRWGFAINFVYLALVWLAVTLPNSGLGVPQEAFAATITPSTSIVIASLLAYLVSQHWDVYVFHKVREYTGTKHLWLRNVASTSTSQLLDTVLFTITAFWALPHLIGIGHALPPWLIAGTIAGQYMLKLGIAAADTPVVYALVYVLEHHAGIDRDRVHAIPEVAD